MSALTSASLIGRSRSSAFRLSTTTVSMSLTGSCFSSESAPRPFHHGIRRRGGTIFWTALPSAAEYGVTNVYGDVGQLFATTLVAQPRACAALIGILIKGLGSDHVCWGTDALWTGSPQWQIEGLRRLEIPEDMQKKYGFGPLGPAGSPVKTAFFGGNNAKLYGIQLRRAMLDIKGDRYTALKPSARTCATATWFQTVRLITPYSRDLD
jgi:hypothetical protein